MAGSKETELKH